MLESDMYKINNAIADSVKFECAHACFLPCKMEYGLRAHLSACARDESRIVVSSSSEVANIQVHGNRNMHNASDVADSQVYKRFIQHRDGMCDVLRP